MGTILDNGDGDSDSAKWSERGESANAKTWEQRLVEQLFAQLGKDNAETRKTFDKGFDSMGGRFEAAAHRQTRTALFALGLLAAVFVICFAILYNAQASVGLGFDGVSFETSPFESVEAAEREESEP